MGDLGTLMRSDALSLVTVMCHNIPEALSFYVGALNFNIKCDEEVNGERFLVLTPPCFVEFSPIASLRFREAKSDRDKACVGNQGGDGVFIQVETDAWAALYPRLKLLNVPFLGNGGNEPRQEGTHLAVTVFDPMGNKVNITERTTQTIGHIFLKDVGV